VEDAAKSGGDTESAAARRDEIEQNLADLRTPDMAILPDHFIWQPTPQASLVRNPVWTYPYPKTYELVAGSASYSVTPRWKKDPLADLQAAIDAAGAPVTTKLVAGEQELVLTANDAIGVGLLIDQKATDVLKPLQQFAQARLDPAWRGLPVGVSAMSLIVGENPPVSIQVKVTQDIGLQDALYNAIQQAAAASKLVLASLVKTSGGNELILSAADGKIREIRLLSNPDDPFSNIVTTQVTTRTGSVVWKDIAGHNLTVVYSGEPLSVNAGTLESVVDAVNAANTSLAAKSFMSDQLLIHSERLGAIELRYKARDATTNILNAPVYGSVWNTVTSTLLQRSMIGVVLSWVLLSLGAPFWYDTLKDLLKLRPAIASKEEAQRNDRMTETKEPAAPAANKDQKAPA
jgi:hypothetical protein